jgi:hypothetical protein
MTQNTDFIEFWPNGNIEFEVSPAMLELLKCLKENSDDRGVVVNIARAIAYSTVTSELAYRYISQQWRRMGIKSVGRANDRRCLRIQL